MVRRKLTTHDLIDKQNYQPYQEPVATEPSTFDESQAQLTQPYVEPPKREVIDPDAVEYQPPSKATGISTFDKLEATLTREYRPPLPSQGELFDE